MSKPKVNTVAYDKNVSRLCIGNYFKWILATNLPIYQVTQITDFGVRARQICPNRVHRLDFAFPSREIEWMSEQDVLHYILSQEDNA